VFDGLIIHVDHAHYRLPNGRIAPREIAVHVGASAIIPVDENGCVTLVRQFRAPLDRVMLEIPAGKLDSRKEDRLLAAKRSAVFLWENASIPVVVKPARAELSSRAARQFSLNTAACDLFAFTLPDPEALKADRALSPLIF